VVKATGINDFDSLRIVRGQLVGPRRTSSTIDRV